jgi:putative hydrolase of the HAD superfamily
MNDRTSRRINTVKYKAIIFDVGDTLLEHYPSEKQIHIDRLNHLGFEVDNRLSTLVGEAITKAAHEQIQKEQNGAPRMSDDDFTAMLDKAALSCVNTSENEDNLLEKLVHLPLPKQEFMTIPGTIEVLQTLKNRGFRLGVVSNHRAWLPDYLKEIGLSDFFETIVVSDIVGVEKPDSRIMQIALNNLSLDASACLYVGDHPFDVLCAKNAGIACAWLTAIDTVLPDSVPYKEDYRIQKLSDLFSFI